MILKTIISGEVGWKCHKLVNVWYLFLWEGEYFYCHKACKTLVVSRCWGDLYTFLSDIVLLSFCGTFSKTIQYLKENYMGTNQKYLWVIVLNVCPWSWNYILSFNVSNFVTLKLEHFVKEQKKIGITKFKTKRKNLCWSKSVKTFYSSNRSCHNYWSC
jgi:hypothetical protein